LYYTAFNIQNSFELAILNHAATVLNIDLYDLEIRELFENNIRSKNFHLPEYLKYLSKKDQASKINRILDSFDEEKKQEILKRFSVNNENNQGTPKDSRDISELVIDMKNYFTLLESFFNFAFNSLDSDSKKLFEREIFNLGLKFFKEKEFQKSRFCFNQLKLDKSRLPHYFMMLSLLEYYGGNLNEAIEQLKLCFESDHKNRFVNVNLGICYLKAENKFKSYEHLIRGAWFIKEHGGFYLLSDYKKLAAMHYQDGNKNEALKYLKIIRKENKDINSLKRLGGIYFADNQYKQAIEPLKEALILESESGDTQQKLTNIHDFFFDLGNHAYIENQFKTAIEQLETALLAQKTPGTIKLLVKILKRIKQNTKAYELEKEYYALVQSADDERREKERLGLINQGKAELKMKNYDKSITLFEKALLYKMDLNVIMFLAHIYKSLNRKRALNDLLVKWKPLWDKEQSKMKSEKKVRFL
ncbi:MAG: hypothetical protein OEY59_01335, partial [Deltaproteobacteria bacterium]|nr:hypothetical protein [Deltaproteobacteria bacterium]